MLIVFVTGAPADHKERSPEVSAQLEHVSVSESGRSTARELTTTREILYTILLTGGQCSGCLLKYTEGL